MEVLSMNKRFLLFFLIPGVMAACSLWLGSTYIYTEYKIYQSGLEQREHNGSTVMSSGEVYDLAHDALKAMGVKHRHLITIYNTQKPNGSATYQMWLSLEQFIGPVEFVVFHEAAHVALDHYSSRVFVDISPEQMKAQEIEADLLACQTLFELGMQGVIIKRIHEIKKYVDKSVKPANAEDHPTFQEIYHALVHFAQSKGIKV